MRIWDEAFDVLVVGSGFAGLCAAIEASSLGASVLVLEKMPYFGGNSRIAGGGYCCWDSSLKLREKLDLGEDSWQLHMEDTLRGGDYLGQPELVEALVKGAPSGLDFLVGAGAAFNDMLLRIGGHSACRSHHASGSLIDPLLRLAGERGTQLRANASVTAIYQGGDGGSEAGLAVNENGQEKAIAARRAIVAASGGFAGDVPLRTAHDPRLSHEYNCTNHKGATGEMIRHMQAVGADTLHMSFVQLFPCAHPKSGSLDSFALNCYSGPDFGLIYVDQRGLRFVNELDRRDVVSYAQVRSCEKPTYSILNRAVFEKLSVPGSVVERGVESGRVVCADGITELAAKISVPPASLGETVSRHNAYVASGEDAEFHKPFSSRTLPLAEGPYYAIAQWPSVHFCSGGVRIDADARVLDFRGDPIPRLFAAGEVCGGIHGSNRLGGNAIAECVVFGRIAGQGAASVFS